MENKIEKYGRIGERDVFLYTLDNNNGLTAKITNYGGIVVSLVYNGIDVVLGRDSLEEYLENNGYFGAIIGRNSNRISNSYFVLDGIRYGLNANDGVNNLHGGFEGFDKKVWDAELIDGEEPRLILKYNSPDGEEGFPGNAAVKVEYTVTKKNSLKISYHGVCDSDTVMNLTNHSYFNLNGHSGGVIDEHTLVLDSSFYTPNNSACIPYGEILKTENTPMDFTKGATLKSAFESDYEQIKMFGGIDHNFILNGKGFRKVGELKGDKTGIVMSILTDRPGVQVYTGNVIQQGRSCKDGSLYPVHGAVCLETQIFPDSVNIPHYSDAVLKKGEQYNTVTEYSFITK